MEYFYIYTKKLDSKHYFLGKYRGPQILPDLLSIKYCADQYELEHLYTLYDVRMRDDPSRIKNPSKPKPVRKVKFKHRKSRPLEVRQRISEGKKGKKYTPQQKIALRETRLREYREGIREGYSHWAGETLSDSHIEHIKESSYNKNRPKATCEYCGTVMSVNMIGLWHGERCPTKLKYI